MHVATEILLKYAIDEDCFDAKWAAARALKKVPNT